MKRLLLTLLVLVTIVGTAGAKTRYLDLNVESSQDAIGLRDSINGTDDTLLVTINGSIDYFGVYCYIQQRYNDTDSLYMRYRPLPARTVEMRDTVGTRSVIGVDTMSGGSALTPIAWVQGSGGAGVTDTVCFLSTSTRGLFYSYIPTRLQSSAGDAFSPVSSKCWQFVYKTTNSAPGTARDVLMYLMFNFQRKR